MPTKPILLLALLATADAAPPTLVSHEENGVTVEVPDGWKVLLKRKERNLTMSESITTTLTLFWYDYAPGATPDIVLDILRDTVHQQLPLGDIQEKGRTWIPGLSNPWDLRRGKQADAEVSAMGITMKAGMATVIDERNHRMAAAFLVAPPEAWAALDGAAVLADVVGSLRLDRDPPLPQPAWYWDAAPPPLLARQPATVASAAPGAP